MSRLPPDRRSRLIVDRRARWPLWPEPPQLQPGNDPAELARFHLLPGFYVSAIEHYCPAPLLNTLRAGDELELAPPDCLEPGPIKLEYGIFEVGQVPEFAAPILGRLLRQGFSVSARVGRIDPQAPPQTAIWIASCLLN